MNKLQKSLIALIPVEYANGHKIECECKQCLIHCGSNQIIDQITDILSKVELDEDVLVDIINKLYLDNKDFVTSGTFAKAITNTITVKGDK